MSANNPARTALITGASGGIGEQTAMGLVRNLPNLDQLFLCCRNQAKGESVAAPLRNGEIAGRRIGVTVVPVELSSISSVLNCAKIVQGAVGERGLDLVVCNAGIMASPLGFAENEEGGSEYGKIEQQFFINHLSHALLAHKLMDEIKKSELKRVVFVSSSAVGISRSRNSAPVISEKVGAVVNEDSYSKWGAYGDSKLAMSLYARGLAEFGGIESVSLHPGVVQTELGRYIAPWAVNKKGDVGIFGKILSLFGFKTPQQGAELSIELSCVGKGELDNGNMYVGLGGKKPSSGLIPLLHKREEWVRVYDDTRKFVTSF